MSRAAKGQGKASAAGTLYNIETRVKQDMSIDNCPPIKAEFLDSFPGCFSARALQNILYINDLRWLVFLGFSCGGKKRINVFKRHEFKKFLHFWYCRIGRKPGVWQVVSPPATVATPSHNPLEWLARTFVYVYSFFNCLFPIQEMRFHLLQSVSPMNIFSDFFGDSTRIFDTPPAAH